MAETATAQRIPVRFQGEGSGVEELTWGQWAAWRSMELGGGRVDWAGGTMPLLDGQTIEQIVMELAFLIGRHQSLRTRYRLGEDGLPRQVLSDSGEVLIEVVEAGAEDPAEVAAALEVAYQDAPFDNAEDWPVRAAVVCRDGTPAWFLVLYSHMAIDAYGIEALIADMANLDRATGEHLAPVAGVQPADLARRQRGGAGRRQHNASLRHWEKQLREIAAERFPPVPDPPSPRYWEASYESPAAYLALGRIAERTKAHSSTILLAAYVLMLARISGDPTTVVRMLVSNRFRPGFKESVAGLAQSALCVVDTADVSFDEVVARVWKTQLTAGLHAYYDPRDLWDMIDRVGEERGATLDLQSYFNDRRRTMATAEVLPQASAKDINDALPKSRLRWGTNSDDPYATVFFLINAVPDTVDITLRVDTQRVAPDDLVAILRGIEELVVAAALLE
ncbi:condensation domain-containing protein [Dactylosporangium sp. NBC_01737]|uniref:condensation domain-containing protein n=1 Tax=Dactylosporangium sp. NBC_01737 TaxID=2975959 RepID=UPI002E1581CF|nr:condensation domain-containing protein [Dactylosporangium sp. NBC_01737]